MPRSHAAPGAMLRRAWQRLSALPGGTWLFARFLAWRAPYSGSIGATVQALEPGFARVALRERRRVRNHLASVHAVALVNLGELATGLAVLAGLPFGVRGILTALTVSYLKKARGVITAECRTVIPPVTAETEHEAAADLRDAAGDVVARVTARWRLAPPPAP